ncbi:hypothetical protein Tco_1497735 [Tanacetum coccineum]
MNGAKRSAEAVQVVRIFTDMSISPSLSPRHFFLRPSIYIAKKGKGSCSNARLMSVFPRNLSIFRGLKGAWKHIRTLEWKWKRDGTPVPSEMVVESLGQFRY